MPVAGDMVFEEGARFCVAERAAQRIPHEVAAYFRDEDRGNKKEDAPWTEASLGHDEEAGENADIAEEDDGNVEACVDRRRILRRKKSERVEEHLHKKTASRTVAKSIAYRIMDNEL